MSHYHDQAIADAKSTAALCRRLQETETRMASWPKFIALSKKCYRIKREGTLFTLQFRPWFGEWENRGRQAIWDAKSIEEVAAAFEKHINP